MPRLRQIAIVALAVSVGLIALLVIALTVAVLVIDADTYRPSIQRKASAALGRQITIDHLAIGRSLFPTITVTGLRIANPAWASRPDLVSVSSASVQLGLLALIRGEIEVGDIQASGVDLLLERNANGVGNWIFAPQRTSASTRETPHLPGFDDVAIRDTRIGWRNDDGTVTEVRIKRADAMLPANQPLQVEAEVVYREVPLDAKLTASTSLGDALADQPILASFALRALDTRANIELALPKLFDFSNVSFNFAANGQQLDKWSALVGQPLPALGPYRVSGRAAFASGSVRLDNLRMFVEGLEGKTPITLSRVEIDSGDLFFGQDVATSAKLAGSLDETRFSLDVKTAELAQLSARGEDIPVNSKVTLDDFEFGAEGTIRLPVDAWGFELATYARGDIGKPVRLYRATLSEQPLFVDLAGQVVGGPSRIVATGLRGRIAQTSVSGDVTLQPGTPFGVNAMLALGAVDLAAFEGIKGKTKADSKPSKPSGPPEWLNTVAADVQLRVERIAGLPVAASGISGRAVLKGGQLEVRKFRGSLADSVVMADGSLRWKGSQPYINASVTLPMVDIEKLAGTAKGKKKKKRGDKDKVFDAPLPLAPLRLVDADLRLNIGRIAGAPVAVDSFRGSAQLVQGRLRVPSISTSVAGVSVRSTIILDASGDNAHLSANVSVPKVDVAKLRSELKIDTPVAGAVSEVTATLETRGASIRSWLDNARVAVRVGASRFKHDGGDEELIVARASAIAGPGVNVRADLQGQYGEYPVDLAVTGGRLVELLDDELLWPKIAAVLNTTFRDRPIRVSAQSALHALLSGRDVPLRVELRSPNGFAMVAGTIADLREPARTPLDVKVNFKGQALQPLIRDEWVLPDLPVTVSAKTSLEDGVFALRRLQFRAGDADLDGDIQLELKDRIKLTAILSGGTLDLRPWLRPPTEKRSDKTPQTARKNRASKLDEPFDLEGVRAFDATLELSLRRVIGHEFDLGSPTVKAELDNGRLDAAASIAEGDLSFELTFDGTADFPMVAIRASTTNLDLESLKRGESPSVRSGVPLISGRVKFAGVGTTPRKVYESARGEALVSAGPGRLRRSSKPFMVQAVSRDLVETLLPGRKPDDYTQMECAAVHFDVADGVVSSPDGMAIRFKEVDLLGSGAVNLTTREILFGFKAVRRRWFSFSFLDLAGDLATIGGTLDNPRVGLDPGGTLVTGGAAWATAGLSLLATRFWRQLGAASDPCAAIIEKGRTDGDPLETLMKDLPLPDGLLESLPSSGAKNKDK
jgi:uncharacterized protein involved in outer membrane biogenesis